MADIYWSSVVLAMPMDGADNSTTFTDIKGKTITRYGDAKISTSQSKFGGASAYFDGTGDYLSLADSGDWDVAGDYTVECWFNLSAESGSAYTKGILGTGSTGSTSGFFVGHYQGGLLVRINSTSFSGLGSITVGVWRHVALVWSGPTFKVYLNGSEIYSGSAATTSTSTAFVVGNVSPYDANRGFYGYIDDVRITKGVARYTSNFTPPSISYFGAVGGVVAALVGDYSDASTITEGFVGQYSLVMEAALMGRYGDASQLSTALVGRYSDASFLQSGLAGQYGDTLSVLAALDGRYDLSYSVLAGLEGRYSVSGSEVLAALEGRYDLRERNEISSALTGYYSLVPDAIIHDVSAPEDPEDPGEPGAPPPPVAAWTPVLIGGVAVKWSSVQWTISEDSYLIEATITLHDAAEFASIARMDAVTITWQGTAYTLFVAAKLRSRSVSGSPGAVSYGVDYTIVARSLTAALDEPYALPTTLDWPAATMASAIAAQLIAQLSDIITLDWRLEDWLQPGGTFFLTDETPLAGLRKLAGIVGGVLQTSPGNALIIRRADPAPPRDWAMASPAWIIDDSGLFSDSESEDISSLYNVITVTNQSTGDNSIRFETEEIDKYRHKVKGFRVPWGDFNLGTSGGAWVTIEDGGVVEESITETVEFVDGHASASNPVHSAVSANWLRSQLGAITASEDGSLTSETQGTTLGCSLAEITYTTKYHSWIGRSDRDEEVQFYAVELS